MPAHRRKGKYGPAATRKDGPARAGRPGLGPYRGGRTMLVGGREGNRARRTSHSEPCSGQPLFRGTMLQLQAFMRPRNSSPTTSTDSSVVMNETIPIRRRVLISIFISLSVPISPGPAPARPDSDGQLFAVSGSMICGISVILLAGIPLSSECSRIAASLSAR